jgi:hypothetical protein
VGNKKSELPSASPHEQIMMLSLKTSADVGRDKSCLFEAAMTCFNVFEGADQTNKQTYWVSKQYKYTQRFRKFKPTCNVEVRGNPI